MNSFLDRVVAIVLLAIGLAFAAAMIAVAVHLWQQVLV